MPASTLVHFIGPDLRLWADGHTHLTDRAIILGEGDHSPADCRLHRQPASRCLESFHIGAVADWFQLNIQLQVWQLICSVQSITSGAWEMSQSAGSMLITLSPTRQRPAEKNMAIFHSGTYIYKKALIKFKLFRGRFSFSSCSTP